jgi:hypothetical protein
MVLDGGDCQNGIESTIVVENRRRFHIIPGSISIEDIERVIGLKLKIKKYLHRTRNVIKALLYRRPTFKSDANS